MTGSLLVVDVGTSGLRAAIVRDDATVDQVHHRELVPTSPAPGFVEFDPAAMAAAAVELANAALDAGGPVDAVGVTNQRASTILWDGDSGQPIGPGVGWQDLRTAGMCLMLQAQGLRLAPNQSATKLAFLLDLARSDGPADRSLRFGTVDTWIVWTLSGGRAHVTDMSNAAVTGMLAVDGGGWDVDVLGPLAIPEEVLPAIVDSSGAVAEASVLPGAPPISGIIGDQQGSLLGQGCVRAGDAKITFGTGGMLDVNLGDRRPAFDRLGPAGSFPIVAWRHAGVVTWGLEAVMLAAGTNVEWLRDDLGLIDTAAASHAVASQCDTTDGVMFVPALLGLGTPTWDYGARGTLLGATRGTGRPHVVRAVLEGVAHRGADLVEAVEADGGVTLGALRVDGGMSANPTFVQALADATQRPVEVSRVTEATTLGAGFAAGLAVGTWDGEADVAATWKPDRVVEPSRRLDRERWAEARRRAEGWLPDLTAIHF
jgi:glycerol kinase